jgi:3-hydroxyisobutyrate dehydrogenase
MVPSAPGTRLLGALVNVGFVGLGAMGLPMARHLVEAGHVVTVASRSREPIDAAIGFGATDGGAPHGVVAASEITILCVPNSPDVVAVLDDALPALGPGKIVVDTSTIDPDVERAQVVKLCNNLIYAAQMLATAEATVMAERAGVDLSQLYEVVTHATGDCVAVRTRLPAPGVVPDSPASNGWAPGFMTDLMAKDLDLAIGFAAAQRTPLFTSGLVRQLLGAASQAGYGREDFSAIAKVVRQLAGA